jgi:hypothetical protein
MDEIPTTSTLWMKTLVGGWKFEKMKNKKENLEIWKKCGMFKLVVDRFGKSEK